MNDFQLSDRIRLELSHPLHAKQLYIAVKKNEKHLSQFLTWVAKMNSVIDFEKYLTNCANEQNEGKEYSLNIFKNNKIIGRIGLHQIDISNKNACIGYWIDKKEQGKGIISISVQKLIKHAFTELGLHRIEILTATHNSKSASIPLKLGFSKEGVLRQAELHGDEYYDLNIYSLLKNEWRNQEIS